MRLIFLLLTFGVIVASSTQVEAANPTTTSKRAVKVAKNKKASQKVAAKAPSELQTDVKFDDSVLHGQYQTPEEALAKVENEKGLSDLLGVRKHFKDRLTTASEQE